MNQVDNNNVAVTAQYLVDKGYSITRAAQNVGCSPAHLTRVLQGDREPSAALLERLRAVVDLLKKGVVCCNNKDLTYSWNSVIFIARKTSESSVRR